MLHCSRNRLHAIQLEHTIHLADALLRTAFLDVSSLNFGGATSAAVFLPFLPTRGQEHISAYADVSLGLSAGHSPTNSFRRAILAPALFGHRCLIHLHGGKSTP